MGKSELDVLIEILQKGIKEDLGFIKKINRPHLLLRSLCELRDDIIDQDGIKNDIAVCTFGLIEKMNNPNDRRKPLLNMIFYGPPGTGKSKIATIVAKILLSLGYIKRRKASISSCFETCSSYISAETFVIFITVASVVWSLLYPLFSKYVSHPWFWFIVGFLVIILIGILIFYFSSGNDTCSTDSCDINEAAREQERVNDSDIIKVVSREHFVGEYLGTTDKKTSKLIHENRGKVIFIDEAYSLYQGPQDMYGKEALDVINRELSEHPDETIIIFAGYEKKLRKTIFKVQPGLISRCPTRFNCNKYTAEGLFKIFKLQLTQTGTTIDNDEASFIKLFREHYDLLPAQGRDCENLINFALNERTRLLLRRDAREYSSNKLSLHHLQLAFEKMKQHFMSVEEEKDDISTLYKKFKSEL